ncbi:MAG: hypothetical protein K1X54_09790 [Flavobacteriales bacterium]|nr:hypothetical protein [Flavobacteriales bacterium]
MKTKVLNFLTILTSLLGYLEWGGGESHSFLFQAEAEVFSKLFSNPTSVLHPFILIPLGGQLMLLLTLFMKPYTKFLTYAGIISIAVLLLLILLIGLMSMNFWMVLSTLPFFIVSTLSFRYQRRLHHKK